MPAPQPRSRLFRLLLLFLVLFLLVPTLSWANQPQQTGTQLYLPQIFGSDGESAPPSGLPWSDPATWGGQLPQAGEDVTIPAGTTVLLDISPPPLGGLSIDGALVFDDADLNLSATWIMLHGRLAIGAAARPYRNNAVITLTDSDSSASVMNMGTRGILLMGGKLELFGAPPSPTWTQLNDHAAAGSSALTLAEAVNWQAGDEIAIAPTDFYGQSVSERHTLGNVSSDQLSLTAPLASARWGRLQYVTDAGMSLTPQADFVPPTPNTPTVLDQRAEVANLSRNIVIQGADDARWRDEGFGAQVMAMAGSQMQIDGVEFRRVGQAGRTGRYPIHFHLMSYDQSSGEERGDASDSFVRNSAIHTSRNRCITIHGSNGLTISDNICYDIRGHALFLEDAVERRNTISGNLALHIRNPTPADRLLVNDGPVFQGGSSGFWLTNPDNIITGNVAADAEGNGFWLSFPEQPLGLLKNVPITPDNLPFGVFDGNTAHSNNRPGLNLDWVTVDDAGNVAPHKYTPFPNGIDNGDYSARLRFPLRDIVTYKNLGGGFWNRVSLPDYLRWVSADNEGTFFAGAGDNGLVSESLVVGSSLNAGTYPSNEPPVALASYHSTFDISNNLIVNFAFVDGTPSGAFKTDDYYTSAVDKGLVRNPNNRLIQAHPGYRVLPKLEENWTLAGALWDPHGYWGPQNNYWVYDDPFLSSGNTCVPVVPAGRNGLSCNGEYYGVGTFITDYQTDRFAGKIPIAVTRLNEEGASIGTWTVGDGNLAPKLGNMRHFAATTGGRYMLTFPDQPIPQEVMLTISNAYRDGDWFILAVSYDGTRDAQALLTSWYHYQEAANWAEDHFRAPLRRNLPVVSDLQAVLDSADGAIWQDRANNLAWVKIRGGIPQPGTPSDPYSDAALYQPLYVWIR